jgi:hypothetical protein
MHGAAFLSFPGSGDVGIVGRFDPANLRKGTGRPSHSQSTERIGTRSSDVAHSGVRPGSCSQTDVQRSMTNQFHRSIGPKYGRTPFMALVPSC